MTKNNHLMSCSICSAPLRGFQVKKCDICGSIVCTKCCYREKGIRSLIRSIRHLPNIMCNRCLYVRQRTESQQIEESPSTTDSSPENSKWFSELIISKIVFQDQILADSVNSYSVEFAIDNSQSELCQTTPITIVLANDIHLSFLLPSTSISYIQDEWVTIHNPHTKMRMYLHIKYLFYSYQDITERETLWNSFYSNSINYDYYLHIFPSSSSIESPPTALPDELPTQSLKPNHFHSSTFVILCMISCFTLSWILTAGFSRGKRLFLVSCFSSLSILLFFAFIQFLHDSYHSYQYPKETPVVCTPTPSPQPPIEEEEEEVDSTYCGMVYLRMIGISCSPPLTRRHSMNRTSSIGDLLSTSVTIPLTELIPESTNVSIKVVEDGNKQKEEESEVYQRKGIPASKSSQQKKKARENSEDIYSVFDNQNINLRPLVESGYGLSYF